MGFVTYANIEKKNRSRHTKMANWQNNKKKKRICIECSNKNLCSNNVDVDKVGKKVYYQKPMFAVVIQPKQRPVTLG